MRNPGVIVIALAVAGVAAALTPSDAAARQSDVVRRSYPFLGDRLIVHVTAEAPGTLRVIRGHRGQIEVAGRSNDGFVGFGIADQPVRQLRLTAVGDGRVDYLVVVPEEVRLSVQLPERTAELSPRQASASYEWGDVAPAAPSGPGSGPGAALPPAGHQLVHSNATVPATVDVPDLSGVRSITVRVEGSDFRVAASRPIPVNGTGGVVTIASDGQPLDVTLFVPATAAGFALRSGSQRMLEINDGRALTNCSGVMAQEPTPYQHWFTFYPSSGRVSCR